MRIYQTHEPQHPGMSDSLKKLARLGLPDDLTGKSVLDIGCNEGFFCRIAKERGAERVVGIDFDRARLEIAKSRYDSLGIDFRCQSWNLLPEGSFDCIIWASAMHYERDPKQVIRRIAAALNEDGLFILECGLFDGHNLVSEMRYQVRHSDVCAYPTRSYLLQEILASWSVREVAAPETVEGDPVPRAVFHCRPAKAELLVVRGPSGSGKTTFVHRHLARTAAKTIHLDYFISRLCQSKFAHNAFLKFLQANYDPEDLGSLYRLIDQQGMTTPYLDLLAGILSPSDRLTVIEGFLTDKQMDELKRRTARQFNLWEAKRL